MTRLAMCTAAICGAILLTMSPAAAQVNDLTCFAVKDRSAKGRFEARLGGDSTGVICKVRMPAILACVRTDGTRTTPPITSDADVTTDVLCYRAKCTSSVIGSMQMTDAVGAHAVRIKGGRFLCLPATTSGATPAPSTTTTLPPPGCEFRDGACRGTCSSGARCAAVVGTGDCACQGTPCGDADSPSCEGFCPDADQACVFNVTGCGCVRIP